jgi:hypothetical protein
MTLDVYASSSSEMTGFLLRKRACGFDLEQPDLIDLGGVWILSPNCTKTETTHAYSQETLVFTTLLTSSKSIGVLEQPKPRPLAIPLFAQV